MKLSCKSNNIKCAQSNTIMRLIRSYGRVVDEDFIQPLELAQKWVSQNAAAITDSSSWPDCLLRIEAGGPDVGVSHPEFCSTNGLAGQLPIWTWWTCLLTEFLPKNAG